MESLRVVSLPRVQNLLYVANLVPNLVPSLLSVAQLSGYTWRARCAVSVHGRRSSRRTTTPRDSSGSTCSVRFLPRVRLPWRRCALLWKVMWRVVWRVVWGVVWGVLWGVVWRVMWRVMWRVVWRVFDSPLMWREAWYTWRRRPSSPHATWRSALRDQISFRISSRPNSHIAGGQTLHAGGQTLQGAAQTLRRGGGHTPRRGGGHTL